MRIAIKATLGRINDHGETKWDFCRDSPFSGNCGWWEWDAMTGSGAVNNRSTMEPREAEKLHRRRCHDWAAALGGPVRPTSDGEERRLRTRNTKRSYS
ncbi:unnamed protein product [Citrullus colocynthis]|uniref:Uncharacterized protein n=1 Tax=Citrullus colocynthis TaxID=252529 RepID=A0ABP0XLH9_9ROSI